MDTLPEQAVITVFVCANCARPGHVPTSSARTRPIVPNFEWTCPVEQIVVPCAGRLQPENVLRAFEKGSSVVSVITCQEDNCHYIEGSRRCTLRMDYLRSLLDEIGLGGERLLSFSLPGSASQDLALTSGRPIAPQAQDLLNTKIEAIRAQIMEMLHSCPPNPMAQMPAEASLGGVE
jgi:coenzyme F420-reducing hydrogenase delta subunit